MTFSERTGIRRPVPPRNKYESAPEPIRALLLQLMQERWGNRESYKMLCRAFEMIPDPGIVGDNTAYRPFVKLINELPWFEVFDTLEQVGPPGRHDAAVNERFVSCGLAYEMSAGKIDLFDPEGTALGLTALEH